MQATSAAACRAIAELDGLLCIAKAYFERSRSRARAQAEVPECAMVPTAIRALHAGTMLHVYTMLRGVMDLPQPDHI